MEKDVAKLDYSPKRLFRKFLLEIQKSWLVPGSIRYKILKLGGVKIEPCFIGTEVTFDTLRPDLISIGEGSVITSGTKIITHFFNPDDRKMFYGPVLIGKNVFVGMDVKIVTSVSIGDNAVIGAGSIITKNVPAGEVWGGNPAHFLKTCTWTRKE